MALYALLGQSGVIGWQTGTLDVSAGAKVFRIDKTTNVPDWHPSRPSATTHSILTIDSSTKNVAWASPDLFTWTA